MQFQTALVLFTYLVSKANGAAAPAPAPEPQPDAIADLSSLFHISCDSTMSDMVASGEVSLPEGTDPEALRQCAEHPVKMAIDEMTKEMETRAVGDVAAMEAEFGEDPAELEKRLGCYFDAPNYGCTAFYCWKSCGPKASGGWCWTANNNGFGEWIGCTSDSDCADLSDSCGEAPLGDCLSCGCSCTSLL